MSDSNCGWETRVVWNPFLNASDAKDPAWPSNTPKYLRSLKRREVNGYRRSSVHICAQG